MLHQYHLFPFHSALNRYNIINATQRNTCINAAMCLEQNVQKQTNKANKFDLTERTHVPRRPYLLQGLMEAWYAKVTQRT